MCRPSLVAPPLPCHATLSCRATTSLIAPRLSHRTVPLSLCRPFLVAPPLSARAAHLSLHHRLSLRATPHSCRLVVTSPPLSSCHRLSHCAAPLSSSRSSLVLSSSRVSLVAPLWRRLVVASPPRRAAFAIVRRVHRRRRRRPLPSTTFVFLESTQWLSAIGRMGAGGGGFDGTTRGPLRQKNMDRVKMRSTVSSTITRGITTT